MTSKEYKYQKITSKMSVRMPMTPIMNNLVVNPIRVPQVGQIQVPKVPQIARMPIVTSGMETPEIRQKITNVGNEDEIMERMKDIEGRMKRIEEKQEEMVEKQEEMVEKQEEMMEMIRWLVERKREKERIKLIKEQENQRMIIEQAERERQEKEEKIPTTGVKRITKEQIEKLDKDEIEKLIGRVAKNVSTYKKKYTETVPEKQGEIEVMTENLRIMREVRNERREGKK